MNVFKVECTYCHWRHQHVIASTFACIRTAQDPAWPGARNQCLRAQGWTRSSHNTASWRCPTCTEAECVKRPVPAQSYLCDPQRDHSVTGAASAADSSRQSASAYTPPSGTSAASTDAWGAGSSQQPTSSHPCPTETSLGASAAPADARGADSSQQPASGHVDAEAASSRQRPSSSQAAAESQPGQWLNPSNTPCDEKGRPLVPTPLAPKGWDGHGTLPRIAGPRTPPGSPHGGIYFVLPDIPDSILQALHAWEEELDRTDAEATGNPDAEL